MPDDRPDDSLALARQALAEEIQRMRDAGIILAHSGDYRPLDEIVTQK